ncbi:sulfotransferase family protein [Gordonia sp. DT30]|uniref:sulfotransferase family protein n=1 Tax=unclassified Gordonia (in: high G+C Gram-positive bacteria) TaxID=2657482 RepID=UPI003CF0258D
MSVVYVHIGLPKTGTTHLQDRLWHNRDLALGESGLLYPGNVISDHFHAAVHLQPERYLDWVDPAFADAWPAMVAQMRPWPQTSLISHELLATATTESVGRLVDDLSFADEVQVIATVRDLARQLPSVWQENVKNQRCASFDEFFISVREQAEATTSSEHLTDTEPFWEFQDYVQILARWAAVVGPERIHVVTVPRTPAAGDGLWERFLSVLRVDPAPLTVPVPNLNSSLSSAQTELLRRLNGRLQPDVVDWPRYERVVKERVVAEIMAGRSSGAARGLSADQRAWVADRADVMIGGIEAAGYPVVGSLDDLRVSRVAGDSAAVTPAEDVLDAALDVLAEMILGEPMPSIGPAPQTRAMNLVRRARRRILAARRSIGSSSRAGA